MIEKLLSNKAHRYIISGGTAFVCEYGTFLVLYYALGAQIIIANSISFTIGLGVSFLLNKTWVFSGEQAKKAHHQFGLYVSLAIINLILTNVFISLLTTDLSVPALLSKLLLMGSVALWNYFIFNKFIFVKKDDA